MSVTVVYRSAADLNRAEYWYEEGPKLQIEVEKLRKVAEAARRVMDAVMAQPQDVKERNIALAWLDAALVELDKEGTVER
mgnify:FL=1